MIYSRCYSFFLSSFSSFSLCPYRQLLLLFSPSSSLSFRFCFLSIITLISQILFFFSFASSPASAASIASQLEALDLAGGTGVVDVQLENPTAAVKNVAADSIDVDVSELLNGDASSPASYNSSFLSSEYAEAAMPRMHGRKTVLVGILLICLFLFLTHFRLPLEKQSAADADASSSSSSSSPGSKSSYPQRLAEAQQRLAEIQQRLADGLNKPILKINESLEKEGKALSVRLGVFTSSIILLLLGMFEILASARRRYKHKKTFPVLKKAKSFKFTAMLMLLLGGMAVWAAMMMGWAHLGRSIYF